MSLTRLIVFLVVLVSWDSSYAAEGGVSNYIPGFYGDLAVAIEPPEGVSVRNDLYYYDGDANRSIRAGQIEANAKLNLAFNYATILYNPGIEVFGSRLAFGITPAIGYVDIDATVQAGGAAARIEDDSLGIGDLTFSGNFYWAKDKWNLWWGNFIVAPVGANDADDLANTGLNYWTFETDLAGTYFDEEKGRDYSVIVGYSYNTKNDDTNYKSGDEFHIDYVFNQFLTESFAIGVNGFFYRQLSGDSGSGAILGDFKGEASGIGPAIYWIADVLDTDVYFTVKWLHEFDVENRFDGDHVFAAVAWSF